MSWVGPLANLLPYPSKLFPSSRALIGSRGERKPCDSCLSPVLPQGNASPHRYPDSWQPREGLVSIFMSLVSLVTIHPLHPWGNIYRLDLWMSYTNLNSYAPSKQWWLCPIWRKQLATPHCSFLLCLHSSFLEWKWVLSILQSHIDEFGLSLWRNYELLPVEWYSNW